MKRRTFVTTSATLLASLGLPAWAAETSDSRLIFGAPAGGLGSKLAEGALGLLNAHAGSHYRLQIVDSRDSRDASSEVKAAKPDGRTMLQAQSGSMVLFPAMYQRLDYDPLNDFTPLAVMGEYDYALSVGPAVPTRVDSIESYLAWVDENPDYRDLGFSLYGSHGHLSALVFARSKEVALRPQSYRVARSLFADLRNGAIAAAISVAGNVAVLGDPRIRPIAISGAKRNAAWPNVATFAEQGIPDMTIQGWYGWFAPARMPVQAADTLRDNIRDIQSTPEYKALAERILLTPHWLEPGQITERMRKEIAQYAQLVDSYGLTRLS